MQSTIAVINHAPVRTRGYLRGELGRIHNTGKIHAHKRPITVPHAHAVVIPYKE